MPQSTQWLRSGLRAASLGVAASILSATLGPIDVWAQSLPTLPPPPAPSSSATTLSAHLAAQLAKGQGLRSRVEIEVAGPAISRPESASFLADSLEVELRKGRPDLVRVANGGGEAAAEERIEVVLAVKDGQLTALARRRLLPASIWEALADTRGRVVATATAIVAIDFELRSLLGLGKREVRIEKSRVFQVSKKTAPGALASRILDCAIGDADHDREPELVLVTTDRVRALRWSDGGFSLVLGDFDLAELPPNESRLREPLGRIVPVVRADGTTLIVAASSERAEPVALTLQRGGLVRSPVSFQRGWPLYTTGVDSLLIAPWPSGIDLLEGGVTEARFGTAAATWVGGLSKVHELRAAHVSGRPALLASVTGSRLMLGVPSPLSFVNGVGVAALLTDLDADGLLELVTSSTVFAGPDRLTIAGLPPRGRPIWSGSIPSPVTAMCVGDIDRDGFEELVVASHDGQESELHLVVPR